MDIIENYKPIKKNYHLVYLAKPIYGGWVTFTAHCSKKYGYPIYKITKKTEKSQRDFGYDCKYQNVSFTDLIALPNIIITAIDKHYWEYLQYIPKDTKLIIHDPTECKRTKEGNPLVQGDKILLKEFKIMTIRETVQEYLQNNFQVASILLKHPFYAYPKLVKTNKFHAVSISRIDFDKNTDIILKANKLIKDPKKKVYLFGAENRLYVHHKLKALGIEDYWKGKFPKTFEPMYNEKSILEGTKYMIDLSTIKGDGGGTQYTFLEALYHNCVLVLHNDWISKGNLFHSGVNCIGVSNEEELANILNNGLNEELYNKIIENGSKIIKKHIEYQID